MNYTGIGIGVVALMFGFITLFNRIKSPEKLKKLEAMKDRFGEKSGLIIQTTAYLIVPIVGGIVFIYAGTRGVSVF